MRGCAVIGLIFVTSAALAAPPQAVPRLAKGTLYTEARSTLLQNGWRPIPVGIEPADCGLGRSDVCGAYPETEYCSGTGRALCSFAWRKRATIIQVSTYGEEVQDIRIDGIRCREGCD